MKVLLVPSENRVDIDGESRTVDLSDLDPEIHVVRLPMNAEVGEIEYVPRKRDGKGTEAFDFSRGPDSSPYQSYIDAWATAPPVPDAPPPDSLEIKRLTALRDIVEEQLEARGLDSDAPQSVKDYITEKARR